MAAANGFSTVPLIITKELANYPVLNAALVTAARDVAGDSGDFYTAIFTLFTNAANVTHHCWRETD